MVKLAAKKKASGPLCFDRPAGVAIFDACLAQQYETPVSTKPTDLCDFVTVEGKQIRVGTDVFVLCGKTRALGCAPDTPYVALVWHGRLMQPSKHELKTFESDDRKVQFRDRYLYWFKANLCLLEVPKGGMIVEGVQIESEALKEPGDDDDDSDSSSNDDDPGDGADASDFQPDDAADPGPAKVKKVKKPKDAGKTKEGFILAPRGAAAQRIVPECTAVELAYKLVDMESEARLCALDAINGCSKAYLLDTCHSLGIGVGQSKTVADITKILRGRCSGNLEIKQLFVPTEASCSLSAQPLPQVLSPSLVHPCTMVAP